MINIVEVTVDSTDTDNQAASQVPITPIQPSPTSVGIAGPNTQAALGQVAAEIKTLQDKQRPFAKVGSGQATNNDDVAVGDDAYRLGNTFIGANANDGTGRKLQVNGGVSVKGDSKIGHFFTKTQKNIEGYLKVFEFENIAYQSFWLEIIIGNDAGRNQELKISCRLHGDTYGSNPQFEIYNVLQNNSQTKIFPLGTELICVKNGSKIELWFYSTQSDNFVALVMQNCSIHSADNFDFLYDENIPTTLDPTLSNTVIYDSRNNIANFLSIGRNGFVGIKTTNPTKALDVNGEIQSNVAIYSPSFVTTSQLSTKENKLPLSLTEAKRIFEAMSAIKYNYKAEFYPEDRSTHFGFGADGIAKVASDLTPITVVENFDADGKEWQEIEDREFEFDEKSEKTKEDQKADFEKHQKNRVEEYNIRRANHKEYKDKWNGTLGLKPMELIPVLSVVLKNEIAENVKLQAKVAAQDLFIKNLSERLTKLDGQTYTPSKKVVKPV